MGFKATLLAAALAVAATGLAQLLPAGEFAARDGRPGPGKTWQLNDEQGQALATKLNAVCAKTPLAIDYDHQTLYTAQHGAKALAAGWIHSVEWRTGLGLWAKVEWTAAASAHIQAGEYRFISPVILTNAKTGVVENVVMASLVNVPALVGMAPAEALNTALDSLAQDFDALNTPSSKPDQQQEHAVNLLQTLIALCGLAAGADQTAVVAHITELMAKLEASARTVPAALSTALGLPATADEAAALAAVTALKAPSATTLQAMQALQIELAALRQEVNASALNKVIDEALAQGKLVPATVPWAREQGAKDLAVLTAYLAAAPSIKLTGQTGGKDPGEADTKGADALATKLMAQFGLTAEEFAKAAPIA